MQRLGCDSTCTGRRQGMVMMLQNRYQRRRMYTRIALGKNRAMDVVSGETSGGSGQLIILYPLLFGLQLGQCWIGADARWGRLLCICMAARCLMGPAFMLEMREPHCHYASLGMLLAPSTVDPALTCTLTYGLCRRGDGVGDVRRAAVAGGLAGPGAARERPARQPWCGPGRRAYDLHGRCQLPPHGASRSAPPRPLIWRTVIFCFPGRCASDVL